MEEMINSYRSFVGKPEEKRPCRRPRLRWEDDIRMDRREIGWEGVNWMHLTWVWVQWPALVNAVMDRRIP
jgi:hypothetical protein